MENESSEIRRIGKGGGRKIGSSSGVYIDGSKVAAVRSEKGLTQKKLSDLVGISQGTLSAVERNKVRMSPMYVERLEAALGVRSGDFLISSQEDSKKEVLDLEDLEKILTTLRSALNLSAQAVSVSLEIIEELLQDLSRGRR